MKNLKELTYDELVAHVEEVIKMLRLRAYEEGYEQGKFDAIVESSVKEARKLIAQLTRDEIIEKAKRDVWKLGWEQETVFGRYVDFKINREKRVVVALLRSKWSHRISKRGIAKCHPDDCFNAAIGRAIALRRALGLEVPDEYLNAPQPTEVRVGDIIAYYNGSRGNLAVVSDDELPRYNIAEYTALSTVLAHPHKIIDDSREEA
jgi:hypothetical protein